VSALLLAAVLGTRGEASIALSADDLVTVESLSQQGQSGIVHPPTKSQHQVKSGFLLDIVVTQSASVFQLLSGKNKTLLVRRNPLFVLNLGLDIVDGVAGFDIKGDCLARKGLYEDLHGDFISKIDSAPVSCGGGGVAATALVVQKVDPATTVLVRKSCVVFNRAF
jgi:hypothetical protein